MANSTEVKDNFDLKKGFVFRGSSKDFGAYLEKLKEQNILKEKC